MRCPVYESGFIVVAESDGQCRDMEYCGNYVHGRLITLSEKRVCRVKRSCMPCFDAIAQLADVIS